MKLVFKNKMLMALENVLQEGEKHGGIPKHVELSTKEATDLLKEIHYLNSTQSNLLCKINIKASTPLTNLQDNQHPVFLIKELMNTAQQNTTPQTIGQFLKFWIGKKLEVSYNGVPLVLDNTTKPSTTEWEK